MSTRILEQLVFSKPYFDRHGLIVATEDERPIGFAHAGFGPSTDGQSLDSKIGATCMLMVLPHALRDDVSKELLHHSEEYLRRHGAQVQYSISFSNVSPFYLGLYGGAQMSGVLQSDGHLQSVFHEAGYKELERRTILGRDLTGFHPKVDRQQILLRRSHVIEATLDPPVSNWWQACTIGQTERIRFHLYRREGGDAIGDATFWSIEPLASSWGIQAGGLMHVEILSKFQRQGLGTFLLSESLRRLYEQGSTLIEAHVSRDNAPAWELLQKLAFKEVEYGQVLVKHSNPSPPCGT